MNQSFVNMDRKIKLESKLSKVRDLFSKVLV